MATIKLRKKIIYKGIIELKSGLHIGGSNAALNIGGPSKFVVRNPITNVPYIPGSSIKGKLRSLIEIYYGESIDGEPSKDPKSRAGSLFGVAIKNNPTNGKPSDDSSKKNGKEKESEKKNIVSQPSRIIVRDAPMDISNPTQFEGTDLLYTESKTEVSINRITAEAKPRIFERVPAGAKFNFEIILNIFEDDNEEQLKDTLETAINLLHDDYLGGNGSRGYGQVEFQFINKDGEEHTYDKVSKKDETSNL